MESNIDRDISTAERHSLLQQNASLTKQNELLKRELQQLKQAQSHSLKELAAYKKMVLAPSEDAQGQVLELQHQRIFDLETQLQLLQGKYAKLVKSNGSTEQTDLALRCRDLERRLKEREIDYQRELAGLRERAAKQSALQFAESRRTELGEVRRLQMGQGKRVVTSPAGEVKKSSLAVRKFV